MDINGLAIESVPLLERALPTSVKVVPAFNISCEPKSIVGSTFAESVRQHQTYSVKAHLMLRVYETISYIFDL